MRTGPTRRQIAIRSLFAALPAALLTSVLVLRVSDAAFSATTSNSGNALAAIDINLSDNDAGAALFSVTGMKPGAANQVSKCIRITYSGAASGITAVKMYGSATVSALAPYLTMTVDSSTTGTALDCSDFGSSSAVFSSTLSTFLSSNTAFSNGQTIWTPASASESRTLKITMTLADDNNAKGLATSGLAFTWEIQTT